MSINIKKEDQSYDAIVVGTGISGGWAAKELSEKGLKTLVLDRGRMVEHLKDYPTTNMLPWEFKHRGAVPAKVREENPIASSCYAFKEDAMLPCVNCCFTPLRIEPEPIEELAFCNGEVAKMSPNSARLRLKPVVPTLAMLFEVAAISAVDPLSPVKAV